MCHAEFATAQNATVEALTEPVNQIKAILVTTTTSLKALSGLPVATLLADAEGTVAVTAASLATILAAVLTVSDT